MMVEEFRRQPVSEHQQGLPRPSPSQYGLDGSSEGGCRWTIQWRLEEEWSWGRGRQARSKETKGVFSLGLLE